jgi:putative aldouronate transport system permease protein
MRIKHRATERAAMGGLAAFLVFFSAAMLYPFLYVLSMSISEASHVIARDIILLPKGFSLDAYRMLLETPTLLTSYSNTLFYTVAGTAINLLLTVSFAYPLSRRAFFLRNPLMLFMTVTMFFGGGLIPSFILIKNLGMYNTRWALLLPGGISAFNAIIARAFFQNLPEELAESAKIEGANDLRVLGSVMLPLSMPILSVLLLYYAVGHWNAYFNAMLYLPSASLQPVQLLLRRILIQLSNDLAPDAQVDIGKVYIIEKMRYAVIIVTMLPIVCVYPFLQRYFMKGVMIGALKS